MRLFTQSVLVLLATSRMINAAYIPYDKAGSPADLDIRAASPAGPTALRPPGSCPNFSTQDPQKYIGDDPPNKCNWKQALICSSLVIACGSVCVGSIIAGFNPFTVTECVACVGLEAGNCAYCFDMLGGQKGVCTAMEKVPYAKCLEPMCRTPKGNLIAPHSVW